MSTAICCYIPNLDKARANQDSCVIKSLLVEQELNWLGPNALVPLMLGWAAVQWVWPGHLRLADAGLGLLVGGGSFFQKPVSFLPTPAWAASYRDSGR